MPNQKKSGVRDAVVLGIETSCDETAAALVRRCADGRGIIISNVVRSQWEAHRPYGGIVPEIAARAHTDCLDDIIKTAFDKADLKPGDIDAVAVAAGPGLIGGLIVGMMTAKSIALSANIPFLAVNHLEAHALTVGLSDGLKPPYLMLLVSGGHTQLLAVHGVNSYSRIGTTIDDALGEAFDKTAKLLGLPQPGGPSVEEWALKGDAKRFDFPRPMLGRQDPHFSFAGLKTAVRQRAQSIAPLREQDVADICASFQQAVIESVTDRCERAFVIAKDQRKEHMNAFVVAGGVAANQKLRKTLEHLSKAHGLKFYAPPLELCGDNAAMIAWAGGERLACGLTDSLDHPVRPRWPLDTNAPAAIGAGVKA